VINAQLKKLIAQLMPLKKLSFDSSKIYVKMLLCVHKEDAK